MGMVVEIGKKISEWALRQEGMFQWAAVLAAVGAILSLMLAYLVVMLLILPLAWLKEKLI